MHICILIAVVCCVGLSIMNNVMGLIRPLNFGTFGPDMGVILAVEGTIFAKKIAL